MKTMELFLMAALALTFAACSNGDNDIQDTIRQPVKAEGITITATLAPKTGGAATRAVSEGTGEIVAQWAVDEHIAILYDKGGAQVADARITSVDASGAATITFSVEAGTADNTACTLVYPLSAAKADHSGVKAYADLLATQDGGLDADLDVRVGAGKILTTTPSLNVTTQPAAQYSIFKFTAQDISATAITPTEFKVSDSEGNVITTVRPSATAFYAALPALSASTYWFSATAAGKPYIAKATVGTATTAGNYYQTTVKMATLGDLMGQDGKFYADAAAISTASTTAIGVIAYLGNDATTEAIADGGGHGLVMCLKNAARENDAEWSEDKKLEFGEDAKVTDVNGLKRTTNVSGYTNTKTLAGKTDAATKYKAAYNAKNYSGLTAPTGTTGWFLPSAQQWVKMIEGLGGLTDGAPNFDGFDPERKGATAWENAIKKAGDGNYDSLTKEYAYYWSSSEYSFDCAITLIVTTEKESTNGLDWSYEGKNNKNSNFFVRPILAF